MDLSFLPGLNASLNALAALLLVVGRGLARRGRLDAHRRAMLAAFATSSLFLASYLIHKLSRHFEHTTFHAEGAAKAIYLAILATHLVLAMAVPVLANALIGAEPEHAKIPLTLETDRSAIQAAIDSVGMIPLEELKVMRIRNTMQLERMQVSSAYLDAARQSEHLESLGPPEPLAVDERGNLLPLD